MIWSNRGVEVVELYKTAMKMMDEGLVDEALEMLKKHQEQSSDDEKYLISELYYERGFYDEAIKLLDQLLKKYPKEGQIITKLAEMYIELEEDEFAIQLLNEIPEDDPYYVASLIQLADLYQVQGLFEVSEQKLLTAKKLAPDEKVIDFALGELFFSIGDYGRAITYYEKLTSIIELNGISILERLAECHALLGHYEKALTFYRDLDSEDPNIIFKYGFTAYQAKRYEIAIGEWEKLIEIDPHYHSVYYHLANAYKEENMFDKAYDTVQQGLKYDEFNKELYFLAGQLSLQLNKEDEAMKFLQKAIELDIDYQEAILLLVQIYSNKNEYGKIIDLITECKRSGAADPLYDWELAKAYREEELYDKALAAYEEASNYLQHDSDFLKEYGYFLIEEGLTEEAINILQKYLEIVPNDEEVFSFIERLKLSHFE